MVCQIYHRLTASHVTTTQLQLRHFGRTRRQSEGQQMNCLLEQKLRIRRKICHQFTKEVVLRSPRRDIAREKNI